MNQKLVTVGNRRPCLQLCVVDTFLLIYYAHTIISTTIKISLKSLNMKKKSDNENVVGRPTISKKKNRSFIDKIQIRDFFHSFKYSFCFNVRFPSQFWLFFAQFDSRRPRKKNIQAFKQYLLEKNT